MVEALFFCPQEGTATASSFRGMMFPTKAKQMQVLYGRKGVLQKFQGNICKTPATPLFYAFAKLCTKTSTYVREQHRVFYCYRTYAQFSC
jgi:hypothetical protein